ncbi:MAG: LAGLIDADG family homing endonuclease [Candidatus Zixiibacteriota bacterium]
MASKYKSNRKIIRIKRDRDKPIYSVLTPKVLFKLYHKEEKSLEDIARLFGCTRMYVMKLSVKYGIRLRTKGQARYLALKAGKLPQQYRAVNHDFFSKWTSKMAYVLGYFCADGCMFLEKKVRLWHFVIASNDWAHLETIRKTIVSTHTFRKSTKQPKLLTMNIVSDKICKDLLKLGITPKKSLTLRFPDVPNKYLNDFIRGYFDGDGSIYMESRNQAARLSISSGSRNFLFTLNNHLEQLVPGVVGKLYKHKHARCYYLRYVRMNDITRLFKYLYPNFEKTLCLKRKFEKFQEALATIQAKIKKCDDRKNKNI